MIPMLQALKAAGWQPSVGYWPPNSGYHRAYNDSAWTLDWRMLSKHQYLGVNSDNTIRVRQSSGMRFYFQCYIKMSSHVLITSVADVTFMAWLLDKIPKLKGFRRSEKTIGINRVYHQDSQMANKPLSHSDFLASAQQLGHCDSLVSWELELLPGHLSINLATRINMNPDAEMLPCLFKMVLSLRQQLVNIHCLRTINPVHSKKNAPKSGAKSLKQLNWFRVESLY